MKKRLRVTALLLALLLALPGFALAEGELLESPSLPDEPVVSCEHEFSRTFLEMTDRVEYAPKDADWHTRTDYALYCNVCLLCGLTTEAWEDAYSSTDSSHDFENGVCPTCGYVCAHENGTREEEIWTAKEEREYVDSLTHTYTVYTLFRDVCVDCGLVFSEEYEVEFTELQAHSYENGACKYCGTKNACPHDAVMVYYGYAPGDSYEQIDERTHRHNYDSEAELFCPRCGVCVGYLPLRHISEVEEHSSDMMGFCACGYEMSCAHANKIDVWDAPDFKGEWISDGAYTHTGEGTLFVYPQCADCGMTWFDEGEWTPVSGTYDHVYELPLKPNRCLVCDHITATDDEYV